jgi:hypothetical protein
MMKTNPVLRRSILLVALGTASGWMVQPAQAQTQALYVVVSAKSSRTALTAKEVLALYTGRIRTLSDGSAATPLDQRSDGQARETFYRALTGMDVARINSYWARLHFTGQVQPPAAVGDDAEVSRMVLADPLAVGYLTRKPVDPGLRVVLTLLPKGQD